MKSLRFIFLLLCLISIFRISDGSAQESDDAWSFGDQTWLTKSLEIPTEKGTFSAEIHFQQGNREFTQRVVNVLSRDAQKVFAYFDYVPSWTVHFVVESKNYANGSATVFPTNIIYLYNYPPIGSNYLHSMDDWVRGLVIHELVHIVHLDQTRGVLKFLSSVFGSFGKWAGVVPRWFTEGIATWAESEFTNSGRLKSHLIDLEVTRNFFNKDFCQTIDCLDEPGIHPHGSNSYWLGSRFLGFLEKRKPGTIRCLVVENSDNIPFFLNSVFKQCAGASADRLFRFYRKTMVKKAVANYKKLKSSQVVKKEFIKIPLPVKRKAINWQNGHELIGDEFTTIVTDDKESYFQFININNKKITKYRPRYSALRVEKQSPYSIQNKKYLLAEAHRSSLASNSFSREWSVYDRRNRVKNKVTFNRSAAYAYMLSTNEFIYLYYQNGTWKVQKRKYKDNVGTEEEVFSFPLNAEIFGPRVLDRYGKTWLITKIYHPHSEEGKGFFTFEALDISGKSQETEMIFKSDSSFEYGGTCGPDDIFLLKDKKTLVRSFPQDRKWNKGQQIKEYLKAPFLDELAHLKIESDKSLLLLQSDPYSIYLYQDICDSVLKKLKSELPVFKKEMHPKKLVLDKEAIAKTVKPKDLDHYPNLDQFLPHYWIFSWLAGDNTDILTAQTSFSDPRSIHKFSVAYNLYPGISKSAPVAGYRYSRDDFSFGLSYGEYFSKSGFSSTINSSQYQSASTSYSFSLADWTYSVGVGYDQSKIVDFISSRKNTTTTLSQTFSYEAGKYYHFLQSVYLNYQLSQINSNRAATYLGHQAKIETTYRLGRNWLSHLNGSYGKLDKKDLSSGIIYGGGYSSFGLNRYHEFYGIPYSDAFGNEMTTGRFMLDWNIKDVYRGSGLFPFFLRELHGIGGVDFLKSDYIFLDKSLFIKEKVTSFFAGARFKSTIGYYVPTNIDFIYAMVNSPNKKAIPSIIIQVSSGGIWF